MHSGGIVAGVDADGQAGQAGVQTGWKVHMLEDAQYSEAKLRELMAGERSYSVTFIKQTGKQLQHNQQQSSLEIVPVIEKPKTRLPLPSWCRIEPLGPATRDELAQTIPMR